MASGKQMIFGKGYWKTYEEGVQREWAVTNGIGGYAGSSIIGANTRKHHGLLIASLRPPVERTLAVAMVHEALTLEGRAYPLHAARRPTGLEEGQRHLQRFHYESHPTFTYHVEEVFLEKRIVMVQGRNETLVRYVIRNGSAPLTLTLTPLFNFRDHGERSERSDLQFHLEEVEKGVLKLQPKGRPEAAIVLRHTQGTVTRRSRLFDEDMLYDTEIATGMSAVDNHYTPYDITLEVPPHGHQVVDLLLTLATQGEAQHLAPITTAMGDVLLDSASARADALKGGPGNPDPFIRTLALAADQFIVDRASTGHKTILAGLPWFSDWGRDTMIALPGLTLSTKRYGDARSILRTFAQYVRNGLVPNMFPDQGQPPLYNTVDASLWYFNAVHAYLRHTGAAEDYDFVQREIYPKLKEIIAAYRAGTDFNIGMDEDGLIHAGSGLDQVTWMDVRVGEWVVTPRHGKPVEINALWYHGLKVMEELSTRFGEDAAEYRLLAERVHASFNGRFWNEATQCLFDVVDQNDPRIRPNQIYAVSLPHTVLPRERGRKVVETVIRELYATYGLRSLSPRDPAYRGLYKGALPVRDAAYHQGTAWAFPLGALVTAYLKVHGADESALAYAKGLLEPMKDHLRDGCIGSIAEIFDGDGPNVSRGCYAQAWSVGEVLRAALEIQEIEGRTGS